MTYRFVKSNSNSDIIVIGNDEGQGGQDYGSGQGTWTNYTLDALPTIPAEVWALYDPMNPVPLYKEVEGTVVAKAVEEL